MTSSDDPSRSAGPAGIPPIPPRPPAVSPWSIRALFALRDAQSRWGFAARSALCMALPVAIGWLTGHEADGMVATLGAFAGLFGASHTYQRRAPLLGWAAFGFVVAVLISALGAAAPWLGVLTIALFGGVTVLICNSLRVGPPGAYMFVLVCATSVAMMSRGVPLWRDVLLVAGGGTLAWLIQMSGVLVVPNGPQKRVVLSAARAVSAFVSALGTHGEEAARHMAAGELYNAWEMLGETIEDSPFHAVNRRAHLLFAMANQRRAGQSVDALKETAKTLVQDARQLPVKRTASLSKDVASAMSRVLPNAFMRRRAVGLLRDGLLMPHSESRLNAVRVTVAALAAGAIGLSFGLFQAYWAVAAAALILHQSASRAAMVHRGVQRVAGTLVGLLLAYLLIALHPQGLWMAALIAVLQFSIEMTIVRNYALGVALITPVSLLVASSVMPSTEYLVEARGIDTLVGVIVAFIVLFAIGRSAVKERLPALIENCHVCGNAVLDRLESGDATSLAAHLARSHLQQALIDARTAYDYGMGESAGTQKAIEPYWTSLLVSQRLGYEVLAVYWAHVHAQKTPELPDIQALRKAIAIERAHSRAASGA